MVRKKNDPPFRPAEALEQKPMSRSERALTAFCMFPMTIHELAGTLQCTYRQAANTVSQLRHMKKLVRHEEVPRDGRGGPARTSRWRAA